jgi:exopolysaccharide biosynthesis polyprenyl glycosylphosphotransferase
MEKLVQHAAPAAGADGFPLNVLGPGDRPGWLPASVLEIARTLVLAAAIMALLLTESAPRWQAAAFGVVVCAIFLAAQRLGVSVLPSASGRATAAALGAALGLLISAGVFWLAPFNIHTLTLFACGGTAFALTAPREAGRCARRILIVGSGKGSLELVEDVARQGDGRFEIVAVIGDSDEAEGWANATFYRAIQDLPDAIGLHRPDLVVINVESGRLEVFRALLDVAREGFQIVGLPEFYEHAFGRVPVAHLTAAWFMSLLHLYQRSYAGTPKRVFDILGASIALAASLPLIAFISVLVRRSVLYRQVRLGEWGRPFTMYKFRTMREDAEGEGQPVFAEVDDPRITRIGRLLRRTRLDEFPQLWNVLRGDMSIVGPRPERPEFYATLEAEVPNWTRRHMVKPGITGWAQVNSGYAYDGETTSAKLSYDLWYLRHQSFLVDLIICVRTLPKLVSGFGAR